MNVLKNIPGLKACLNRVDNNGAFVNIGNKHTKKNIRYDTSMQENQISHTFCPNDTSKRTWRPVPKLFGSLKRPRKRGS